MKITRVSQQCLDLIMHFEAFHSKPYVCPAGKWTIGYGFTFNPLTGEAVTRNTKPITLAEGREWLRVGIRRFEAVVDQLCRDDLKQHEFDALVSFAFNAGTSYIDRKGIKQLYLIWANVNHRMAPDAMKKYWENLAVTGGGKRLPGLVRRRKAEYHLFSTGKLHYFLEQV